MKYGKGRTENSLTVRSNSSFIVGFEDGSQYLGIMIDDFTDPRWFGEAGKGRVAPLILFIEHSYLPRWSRLVEQGKERQ
jgi:hypothetical protein